MVCDGSAEVVFLVVGSWRPLSGRKKDDLILLGCNALKVFAGLRNANRSKDGLVMAVGSLQLDIPKLTSRVAEACHMGFAFRRVAMIRSVELQCS